MGVTRIQHGLPSQGMDTSPANDGPPLDDSVKLRVHFDDLRHPAADSTLAAIESSTVLETATKHVFRHLYRHHGKPQAVRSITLIFEPIDGVAYTTGLALDDLHKEIHFSLNYLKHKLGDFAAFRHEAMGVIVHEMVHCWQHNACGTAPGGLIEGIADYVRLKSNLSPPHWHKSRTECGKRWDEGYQKTAWFLEWLENEHGPDTVGRMNDRLDGRKYDQKEFWHELFGKDVDDLWKAYLKTFDEEDGNPNDKPDGKQGKHFEA